MAACRKFDGRLRVGGCPPSITPRRLLSVLERPARQSRGEPSPPRSAALRKRPPNLVRGPAVLDPKASVGMRSHEGRLCVVAASASQSKLGLHELLACSVARGMRKPQASGNLSATCQRIFNRSSDTHQIRRECQARVLKVFERANPQSACAPPWSSQRCRPGAHRMNTGKDDQPLAGKLARSGFWSEASVIFRVRARSAFNTTRNSSLASGAPGQTCTPAP